MFVNKLKIQNLPLRKKSLKINIIDEDKINTFLNNFTSKKIILDRLSCSIAYTNLLKNKINISNKNDPIYNMKSIKNDIEIKNFIKSHIFDGVAVIKFLYWIKNYKKRLSELDAVKKLNFLERKIKIIYSQALTQFLHQVQMVQLFIIE